MRSMSLNLEGQGGHRVEQDTSLPEHEMERKERSRDGLVAMALSPRHGFVLCNTLIF
jgi:hypothetical protein